MDKIERKIKKVEQTAKNRLRYRMAKEGRNNNYWNGIWRDPSGVINLVEAIKGDGPITAHLIPNPPDATVASLFKQGRVIR